MSGGNADAGHAAGGARGPGPKNYYAHYTPSQVLAGIATGAFALALVLNLIHVFQRRAWIWLVMVFGCTGTIIWQTLVLDFGCARLGTYAQANFVRRFRNL